MAAVLKNIKLKNIFFDLNNPRHDPVESEADAVQMLLTNGDVRPLARHISQVGSTSPLDLMALVPHPKIKGAYITAEGNRRLCALKLLLDPDKANTDSDKRYFHTLKKSLETPITEITGTVFLDMKTARPWVELRHKGAQDGRGIKAWGTDEQARFDLQGNANNPNARALLLVSYARAHSLLPEHELKEINLTTITRYLSNRVFRHTLGITDAKFLQITAATPEFERVLVRFLRDSLGENPLVHSRSSAIEREAYAESLRKEGVAPEKRDMAPYQPRVDDPNAEVDSIVPSAGDTSYVAEKCLINEAPADNFPVGETLEITPLNRDNRSFDKRKFVIKSDFAVRITDRALKDFYDELKRLDATEFVFSSVYLLRSVIERGAAEYLKRKRVTPKQKLHEKIEQLVTQLKTEGKTDRELKFLRAISENSRDDHYSPDTLGHFIHGGAILEKTYAFRYWDSLEPIMRHILHDPK